jgi:PTH1 family peptidyl-tRNA hydrolase
MSSDAANNLHLIVGLGNPGPKYAATRHNIGYFVLELLAARARTSFKRHPRANAVVAETRLPALGHPTGLRVVLARSLTYMNTLGGPVAGLAKYYGIGPEQVVAVHDDVDLPFETVRLKKGGGEGGHNGLRDITRALGTKDYLRVRMGVGRPPGNQDTADFVLSRFSGAEVPLLPAFIDSGADAVTMLLSEGLLATQQRFHS